MAAVISLCASNMLSAIVMQSPLRHTGLHKLIPLKYMEHCCNIKGGRKHACLKAGASHHRLVVLAVTEGSAKSRSGDDKVPSWAKPDSDEPPPWAHDEGVGSAARPPFVIPFYAYLLASAVTAIAAIGSMFEYVNQRPVFGILSSDSIFYAPLLGFFAFTGIPTSAFLWFKSVQAANKEAEEQDRRDGYS
ncbi:uncharacterized protein LOC110019243 [Phalaenopsis equestris]|uniref:uncharacterized protein LOC110019243 n=1 Tax=Phalaenopsis equestris TaxID=78828 RepID=UPI0009E343E8|nr:uncharacterized protein LOC110019243 [Phalaenopsis equestris]XP_020572495.1 uncharacterized protein LOC110019243 [Phalaenopsis equestris]